MTFGGFVCCVLAVAILYVLVVRQRRRPPKAGGGGQFAAIRGGDGSYSIEAVGESHYQDALRWIVGPGEVAFECDAELHMEDTNQFDRLAVAVIIKGRLVGYLNRSDARSYRAQIAGAGRIIGTCAAKVFGGGEGRHLSVWLDLPSAD